eukprot:s1607_g11.t1
MFTWGRRHVLLGQFDEVFRLYSLLRTLPVPAFAEIHVSSQVFQVKRLEKFNNFVQVIFYDVRSAAAALKAFGEAGCIPGPQVGERTVKLAGDDQLSTKDFQNISEVLKSKDGTFFLEFYDIRDAMRYRTPKDGLPHFGIAPREATGAEIGELVSD